MLVVGVGSKECASVSVDVELAFRLLGIGSWQFSLVTWPAVHKTNKLEDFD